MQLDKRKADDFFNDELAKERLNSFLRDGDCYPLHVVIHPTMNCNHRCNFCNYFHNLDSYEREDSRFQSISVENFSKLLDDLEKLNASTVVISGGGDPLAHKDIKSILQHTASCSFSKHIYTNLDFNLADEVIEALSKFNSLNVNINTFDAYEYSRLRGKNADLSRVSRNLKLLSEKDVCLRSVVIVKDDTIDSVKNSIDSLLEHGVTQIVISPAFDLEYLDSTGVSKNLIEKLLVLKSTYSNYNIKFVRQVEDAVFEDSGDAYCRTHYFDVTIGADSFIYPCCLTAYREEYKLVCLKNFTSFKEAWNSSERKSKISNLGFKCSICWFGKTNQYLQDIGVD